MTDTVLLNLRHAGESSYRVSVCLALLIGTMSFGSVCAADDTGTASSGKLLNGSAKEREEVTASVKLVPPAAQTHILNGSAGVAQFNGQVHSTPGQPSYPVQPVAVLAPPRQPLRAQVYTPVLPARIFIEGPHKPYVPPAPPKWNYTLTPKNGIMNWAPGYSSNAVAAQTHVAAPPNRVAVQVQVSPVQGQPFNTTVVRPNQRPSATLDGSGKRLPARPAAPPVVALQATPQLLTELSAAKVKRSITWEEWYRRVCKVIYAQWLLDQACPGKACVRVTVWSGRDIECKVIDFIPATGATRDAVKETGFRETALRAVNSLGKTAILDFPLQSNRNKVIFDLDMNRSVDGPSGCQVAKFHDVEETMGKAPAAVPSMAASGRGASKSGSKSSLKTASKSSAKSSARGLSKTASASSAKAANVPAAPAAQDSIQSRIQGAMKSTFSYASQAFNHH